MIKVILIVPLLIVSFFTVFGQQDTFSFPVSDKKLLQIWEKRIDLQGAFPEVKNNDFTGLKKWAVKHGWNEDPVLSALIPEGKIPDYLKKLELNDGNEKYIPITIITLVVITGVFMTVYILKSQKTNELSC